jgi:hypothetical protein
MNNTNLMVRQISEVRSILGPLNGGTEVCFHCDSLVVMFLLLDMVQRPEIKLKIFRKCAGSVMLNVF